MKDFFAILSGALTPLIAVITAYIAYQQFLTNKMKLMQEELANKLRERHELYDRRLAVFTALMDIIISALTKADESGEKLIGFHRGIAESYFLFDQEIINYLHEIEAKYKRLQFIRATLELPYLTALEIPDEVELARLTNKGLSALLNEAKDLFEWFNCQFEVSRRVFSRYLTLKELSQVPDQNA